jgi:hypothetical protein
LKFRRDRIDRELFSEIKNPAHILHDILPLKRCSSSISTRNDYTAYELPIAIKNQALVFLIVYAIVTSSAFILFYFTLFH